MAINENSFKPTLNLDIDKSKDISSLKSIITDINKIGKNATINIIQNQDITDKEKYLSLWEQNIYLHEVINQIENKLIELEKNSEIYHEYRITKYDTEKFQEFLTELNKNKVKFIKKVKSFITPGSGQWPGHLEHEDIFKVLDKDNESFLKSIKKYNIGIK